MNEKGDDSATHQTEDSEENTLDIPQTADSKQNAPEIYQTEESKERGPDAAVNTPEGVGLFYFVEQCEYEMWRSPDDDRTLYRCDKYSQQVAVDSSPSLDSGSWNETIDEWRCECGADERTELSLEEESCRSAIGRVCGVSLDELNFCETGEGQCWPDPSQEDGWRCICEDRWVLEASFDAPASDSALACKQAAFQQCALECESPLGECKPNMVEQIYDCDCAYYPTTRSMVALNCEQALRRCNPRNLPSELLQSEPLFCSNYAGSCDRISETTHCQCLDGTDREVDMTTYPNYPNLETGDICGLLNEICGDETEQIDKWSCLGIPEPGRFCSASYDFDTGLYDCDCHSISECGERYDFYSGDYDTESCEQARDTCLEDDSQRNRVEPEPCGDNPTRFCEREATGNRHCWAYSDSEDGVYSCQCVNPTDSETDTWYTDVDQSDCELALDACIEQDAARE